MNLPTLLDNKTLAKLAAPDEKMAVRVIIRQVFNNKPYRLRGRIRHYLADHNAALNVHVLDVPASVWMRDFPTGTYKDNPSIAHDIQGNRMGAGMVPLLFSVIEWKGAESKETKPAPTDDMRPAFDALRELAETLGAPGAMLDGIKALDSAGLDASAIAKVIRAIGEHSANDIREQAERDGETSAAKAESTPDSTTKAAPMSNAERQKAYRDRKAAEKAAEKPPAAKKAAKKAATKKAKQKPQPATA